MALTAPGLYDRVRTLLPEMIRFGVVGGLGTVIDLGGAALLQGKYHAEPLAAKAISVSLAMVVTYLGSRFWTFKERENQSVRREAVLFLVLNTIGLLVAEAVIGLVTYVMGLHGHLAYNAASFVGTGLGTIFRFYAYRKWIFLAPEPPAAATLQPDSPMFPDYPPWELDPNFLEPLEPLEPHAQARAHAPAPVPAPVYSAPWAQEPAVSWDPALAPTMSWGVAPSLAPTSGGSAPYRPGSPTLAFPTSDLSVPSQEVRRPAPAPSRGPSRAPRSSGGGRHRKS